MTMVHVPEGRECQLKVNIMSNRKKVMLTKDAPFKLSSGCLRFVNWTISFCLTSQHQNFISL